MKRILVILIAVAMLGIIAVPMTAQAQCGNLRHRHGNTSHTHRACAGDGHRHGRSFWQKHRDKITTGGGALGGAILGGVVGGKKGAVIGAVAGGGGAAVYTYGIRKRRRSARRY